MSSWLRAIFRFRGRRTRRREIQSRRRFLVQSAVLFGASVAIAARWLVPFRARGARREGTATWRAGGLIRPPTASADDIAFTQACIRCGLCGTVCKSGCIRYFGLTEPEHGAFTPYIDVRDRSCVLCMRCTQVCPTGALSPVDDVVARLPDLIDMGTAEVDADRCLSYQGRICGYCYDACPLPDVAIKLIPKAKPVVIEEGCVGCGRCVELCPQSPTAIDVRRRA
jgi:ferredoxin-type protein NapG